MRGNRFTAVDGSSTVGGKFGGKALPSIDSIEAMNCAARPQGVHGVLDGFCDRTIPNFSPGTKQHTEQLSSSLALTLRGGERRG